MVGSPCSPRDSREPSPTPQFKSINYLALSFLSNSHPYMTTGKTKALTTWTFVGKVMSMLFNMLSAAAAKSLQLCPALCDPMDCSLPGSSIHGIFQGRVLEWVAIAFSNMLSRLVITFLPRIKRLLSLSFPTVKQGERYLLSGFLSGFHEVTNIKKHSGQCLVRG